MSSYSREKLIEILGSTVRAHQRAIDELDEAVAVYFGVNRSDLRCLDVLMERGSATPGELADAVRLTTGSVTAMLDRLERIGYVVRTRSEAGDRRRLEVRPTQLAMEGAARLYGPLMEDGQRALRRYKAADMELIIDFLQSDRERQQAHAAKIRALNPLRPKRKRERS